MFLFHESDAAIVRRTLAGSPEAFEPLVFRYQKKAHAIARSLGLRHSEADDAVQEAFLQAFRDLHSLRDPARFGSWFLHIVRHVSLKVLRQAARSPEAPAPGGASASLPAARAGDPLERRDFSEYLWRKVAELPEGVREAVFIFYYEGGSVREVARALGIAGVTAKKRLKAGRDQLREKLWRELEQCLRDMLPSAREWRGRARQIGLLIMGSIAASWAARAGAVMPPDAGTGDPLRLLAARTRALVREAGKRGFLAGNKKLALGAALALAFVFLGVSVPRLWNRREDVESVAAPRVPPPSPTPASAQAHARAGKALRPPRSSRAGVQEAPPTVESATAELDPQPPPEDHYGSVLVRVIWGDDKTPAAGVRGMVIPWGSPHLYGDERPFVSGQDGTVRVDHVFRGGGCVMLDRGGRVDVKVESREVREAVVEVPPGIDVEGVVVDRDGFSFGGARIWISYTGHTNWGNEVAVTATDGSFSLRAISGSNYIAARAPGHSPSDLRPLKGEPGLTLRVRLRLGGPAGAIAGAVRDGRGEPVAYAKVMVGAEYARYTLLEDGATGLSGPPFLGFTDEEGEFQAESVPPGRTRVAVRAPGFASIEEEVVVRAGYTSDVDLILEKGAVLVGRVTGSKGQPASGVMVAIGEARDFLSLKVFTSSDGSYRIEGVPPGEVEIHAQRKEWGKAGAKLVVKGGETVRWDAVLAQDREISGRVLDETGTPLPGFVVLAEEMLGKRGRRATQTKLKADEEGRFRISDLSDLAYRVLVFEPDSPFPCLFVDDVRPGPEEVVVEVERESLSSVFLAGKVLLFSGSPAGGAKVICASSVAGYRVYSSDNASGDFRIGPVPPGSYRLEVQVLGSPPAEVEVKELQPRERRDLGEIWIGPGG